MTTLLAPSSHRARALLYIADLWRRREFAWFLAVGNLKARNASTALGLLWWVLNPLLLGMVYFFVFGFLFGERDIGYLLAGMFPFHFTAQSMTGGANSVLSNSRLLINLRFPRLVLPIAYLIESMIGFITSLGVLVVILFGTGGLTLSVNSFLLLVLLPMQFAFNLGLASLTARLAVPFRDINNFLPYVSRLWLYTSPVIWPLNRLDSVAGWAQAAIELNPMFSIIALYRAVFLGYPLTSTALVTALLWSLGVCAAGIAVFVRFEGRMVRHL